MRFDRYVLTTLLGGACTIDAFAPKASRNNNNKASTTTTTRLADIVSSFGSQDTVSDGSHSDSTTSSSMLWQSPLQGMGGDYANMRGMSTPPPKGGQLPPPPTGPLKGIGGDYANVQTSVAASVETSTMMPVSTTTTTTTTMEYPPQQQAPPAAPVATQEETVTAYDDVAVTMEQVNLVPPRPLRGIGGDYAIMNEKISMFEYDDHRPFVSEPASPTAAAATSSSSSSSSFGPLRGIGGDYANVQGISVEMRMPPAVMNGSNGENDGAGSTTA